jgi:two-component system nitrate/nitrite response regulator NarL
LRVAPVDIQEHMMDETHDKPYVGNLPRPHDAQTLRVAVLGDRALCSACLRILLRECDDRIIATDAASGAELLHDVTDVAILPLLCPHVTTLSEVSDTARALGGVPLVVLIDRSEPQIVNQLVSLGARGVLTFDLGIKVIAAALRLVTAGGVYIPPQFSGRPPAHAAAPAVSAPVATEATPLHRLSPRERAVLDLLRRSLSNREIATTLGIAEATVKIHVRNLLRKTRARNRVELALLAARSGD